MPLTSCTTYWCLDSVYFPRTDYILCFVQKKKGTFVLKLSYQAVGVIFGDLGTVTQAPALTASAKAAVPNHLVALLIEQQSCLLTFQTQNVGTSPLYTFPNVFSSEPSPLDVLGAVSIIFWTITLITIVKYILIVMNFNDEGEGMPLSHSQSHSEPQTLLSDLVVHQ